MAGAILSTLHQKVKFVTDENLIVVIVEEDMVSTTIVSTLYSESKKMTLSAIFGHLRFLQPRIQRMDSKCQHLIYHRILG